jgi:hypothetical protein
MRSALADLDCPEAAFPRIPINRSIYEDSSDPDSKNLIPTNCANPDVIPGRGNWPWCATDLPCPVWGQSQNEHRPYCEFETTNPDDLTDWDAVLDSNYLRGLDRKPQYWKQACFNHWANDACLYETTVPPFPLTAWEAQLRALKPSPILFTLPNDSLNPDISAYRVQGVCLKRYDSVPYVRFVPETCPRQVPSQTVHVSYTTRPKEARLRLKTL